jgi:hypothetical protein
MSMKLVSGGRRRRRTRRVKGGSIGSWLRKAHDWIKKHKLVSRIGSVLGSAGVPGASMIGTAAGSVGYGRRRRRVGYGLKTGGMGMAKPFFATRLR